MITTVSIVGCLALAVMGATQMIKGVMGAVDEIKKAKANKEDEESED